MRRQMKLAMDGHGFGGSSSSSYFWGYFGELQVLAMEVMAIMDMDVSRQINQLF
ncbi:MAG: hypothetical protein ACH0QD_08060 [Tepidibacillus sp.]